MYLLYTDETNKEASENVTFFVYGGLIVPFKEIVAISDAIDRIRFDAGYKSSDIFKFDTNARPKKVSPEKCTAAKKKVVNICLKHGCKFIVYVILHDIIKNQDINKQICWGADYVVGRFNRFLEQEVNDHGIAVFDNLPIVSPSSYLSEKFTHGLKMFNGYSMKLDRIKLFASSSINSSHIASAMDIVLGSFRYCINNAGNREAAKGMMGNVCELLWHKKVKGNYDVADRGLIIRPQYARIRAHDYKEKYDALFTQINSLLD